MTKLPGMAIFYGESETMTGDGTGSPGDAVARDGNGKVTTADGTDNPNVCGVLSDRNPETHDDGDEVSVQTAGTIVTNVTTGTVDGDSVGPSATAGALTSGGSAGNAFSDAGGAYRGAPCPDGYAAVRFGGVN